ncbi:MAG TPA: penicillin-binding transpeptidase domain-containing protein, partial [Pyrinomonadaceae bacterium]|nr:penicillin-binding transpeptidase domain-containing protein [Pyrinomonadaceae bacterium]
MNRRTFIFSGLTALAGVACRSVQIEDLTNHSPRYDVSLTLDEAIQEIAQKKIASPILQAINKSLPADTDMAFVCLANETGNVLAYIPTIQKNKEFDNCRQAKRGIASTIKPFIYGIALESGAIRSEETFLDAPAEFPRLDSEGTYSVDNYKNQYTMRELTIEEAIAISSNVVAMRVYHRIN